MKVKKHDFIELEFVGRIKNSWKIFDLTNEEIAKENNIHNPNARYKPIIICVGEGEVVKGLDAALEGKETGKDYTIEVKTEDAFGKKNAKLMKLVSTNMFKKQNINPFPGLQVNIDNTLATIVTVNGGRTMVDFNHPLANKDIVYDIKINRIITDDKEKLKGFLEMNLHLKDPEIKLEKGIATINLDMPEAFVKQIEKEVKKRIPSIKSIRFKTSSKG